LTSLFLRKITAPQDFSLNNSLSPDSFLFCSFYTGVI
jgi:hypothetical protein